MNYQIPQQLKDKPDRIFQIMLLGIYLVLFMLLIQNLRYPYLWYDEAVQFWISKGLSPDSEPYSTTGNIFDTIENNKHYNMDPGGFGIILHFWTLVSNHHIWLRLLPFFFFIGVVLAFIYLSFSWHKNLNIALTTGLIPIFYPMLLTVGFEVRGYSMEVLCTLLSMVALIRIKQKVTIRNLLTWSLILALLMTSRYSAMVIVFVVSLYISLLIYKSNTSLKYKLLAITAYSTPLLLSLIYSFTFALRYQNTNIEPLYYLPYLSRNLTLLLDPLNLLYIFFISICIFALTLKNKFREIRQYEPLIYVTGLVTLIFMIFSFAGMHPWSFENRRCISMVTLGLLCFSALTGELIKPLYSSTGLIKYYLIAFGLFFMISEGRSTLLHRYGTYAEVSTYSNFRQTDLSHYDKIYVDRWESPSVKYLFEYGRYYSDVYKNIYPGHFTFTSGERHRLLMFKQDIRDWYRKQPTMNELTEYDLLITPELYKMTPKESSLDWTLFPGTTNFWIKRNEDFGH